MIQISKKAGIVALQAHAEFLDRGAGAAYFAYYSGAKPASTEVAANPSNLLCVLPLPEPCIKQVLVDGIELYETEAALANMVAAAQALRAKHGAGAISQ